MRAPLSALCLGASALSLVTACSASRATPVASPAAKPPSVTAAPEVPASLRRARAKAKRLEKLAPPVYAGSGEADDALAWRQGPLLRWYEESVKLYGDADQSFFEATQSAGDDQAKLAVTFEAFTMGALFFDRLVAAVTSTRPRAWPPESEDAKGYARGVTSAAEPRFAPIIRRCAEQAEALGDTSATARECIARRKLLGASTDEASATKDEPVPSAAPEPAWRRTELIAPCTFRGSFHGETLRVYTSPTGGAAVADLQSYPRIELERVELAAPKAARTRIDITAPIRMTAWVDATTPMFALPTKLPIADGHAWFLQGAPAVAQATSAGNARLTVSLKGLETRFDFTNREQHVDVACDAMTLSSGVSAPDVGGASEPRITAERWIPLYDLPKPGKAVGRIHGPSFVQVRAHRNGYSRITATEGGVGYDAWVRGDALASSEDGMIGLLNTSPPEGWTSLDRGAHRVLDVRMKGAATSPVVFQIAEEKSVLVKSGAGPFAEVKVDGVLPVEGAAFFVAREQLPSTATGK